MAEKNDGSSNQNWVDPRACLLGGWTAILTSISALSALAIAITTAPARSGPNCPPLVAMGVIDSCVGYPYTDVAAYVPTEYIWMYPAFLLSLFFTLLITATFHCSSDHKSISTHIALIFSIIATTVHCINYFIQLAVVQPSLLKGELSALTLLSQYNPHGVFIALEDLGYLIMGCAFLFLSFGFSQPGKLTRSIKYLFQAGGVIAIAGLLFMSLWYKNDLEYRYEVLSLTTDWIVLIVTGMLLFFYFKRIARSA